MERITEDAGYEGLRIKFIGYLDNAMHSRPDTALQTETEECPILSTR